MLIGPYVNGSAVIIGGLIGAMGGVNSRIASKQRCQ